MANADTRRDTIIGSLTHMRHKANPYVLEEGIRKYMNLLKHDPKISAQFMEGGSLKNLADYTDRNTAVLGYLLNKLLFKGELGSMATRVCCEGGVDATTGFPTDCTLYVCIKATNLECTKKDFQTNARSVVNSTKSGTSKMYSEWTGYGVNFDVAIALELRPPPCSMDDHDRRAIKFEYKQRVVIEPCDKRTSKYTESDVAPPAGREFPIGAVINLLHDNKLLADTELRKMLMIAETNNLFPRHNESVQKIEAALEALGHFVDMIVKYLASLPPFRPATSRQSEVAMPWGPARHELKKGKAAAQAVAAADEAPVKKELPDGDAAMGDTGAVAPPPRRVYVGNVLGNALDQFHRDQCNELLDGMGVLGDLMQRLSLLKAYATHFGQCYASIDHYMVRSFMKGIGVHNAVLFEKSQPLDPLLNKIALFQADRAGIELSKAEIDITGCSVTVEVRMPGNAYFEPLKGIPAVHHNFNDGKLRFGGIGSKGISVAGEYTRYVFVLPTESDGGAKPKMRVSAKSEFANTPVVVVVGTPDGKCTNAKAVFLLVDTWCMQLAIEVGTIPSNKAFGKAMSRRPPAVADFATAIRACDIAEGGLDLHVIYLAPLLASALRIEEVDLMGDPDWMTQLVGLMRGGVSLQSLAQGNAKPAADKDGWQDVPSPKYDLEKIKEETTKLEKRMLKQGVIDHYVPPQEQSTRFRSCGADDVDSEPSFRSLSGMAAEEPAPMAVDAAPGAAAAPTSSAAEGGYNGDGDASVDALADTMKDLKADDDSDFMGTLLKHAEKTIGDSECVLGAKLTVPHCATNCFFAKGKVPDGKRISDFMGPSDTDKWEVRPNLDAASLTIQRMLRAYAALGKPVTTTRLTVFGAFVEWETNLLTGLMSGSIDPTNKLLGAYKALAKLQKK